jgi:integrase
MTFSSKTDAQAQADTWRDEFQDGGKLAFFTNDERLDAASALKLYRDAKVKDTLSAAVHYYLEHRYPLGGDLEVSVAVNEYIKEKESNKAVSQFYIWSLNRLLRLADAFAGRKLSSLTAREILNHIYTATNKRDDTKPWGQETQRQHFRYYKMFFGWCVENKHLGENPLARKSVNAPKGKQGEPMILYLDSTQKLISASWELVVNAANAGGKLDTDIWKKDNCDHRLFIYLALGIFAGIRPQEITRLYWEDIPGPDYDWIHLSARITKTNDKRHMPLSWNLAIMVREYCRLLMPENGNVNDKLLPGYYDAFKIKFRKWRARVIPYIPWPHDCMRHSYASWFAYTSEDMRALMARMGHSQSHTTLHNYTNIKILQRYDWQQFWTLLPEGIQAQPPPIKDPFKLKRHLLHLT